MSSALLNSSLCLPATPSVACTQLKKVGEESSLALCNETSTTTTTMSPSSLRSSTEPSGLTHGGPVPDPHALAFPSSGPSRDPPPGSLRKPRRVRMLRRSWSAIMPGSRSLEALFDKTKATLTGKSHGKNPQSQEPPKVQKNFSAKTFPRSSSQGSVAASSSGRRLPGGAANSLLEPPAPRQEVGTWRCRAPFTHCFLRRRTNTDGADEDKETSLRSLLSKKLGLRADRAEQATAAMADASLKARLERVNSMKGKTYSLHTGFALARKDALEMAGVLRCGLSGPRRRGEQPEVEGGGGDDAESFSQLLLMQAKVLRSACSRMALEYGSPEELLLTLTHSFHTLCCLTQACMSLAEGLGAEGARRELVSRVDEVVMNYVCLLRAAEAASGSSPSDQSVNALTHHSATMSAVINALTHSLNTLLNK